MKQLPSILLPPVIFHETDERQAYLRNQCKPAAISVPARQHAHLVGIVGAWQCRRVLFLALFKRGHDHQVRISSTVCMAGALHSCRICISMSFEFEDVCT